MNVSCKHAYRDLPGYERGATLTAWSAFERHPLVVGSCRGESWRHSLGWEGCRRQPAERSILLWVQPFGWKTSAGADTETWQHRTPKLIDPGFVFFLCCFFLHFPTSSAISAQRQPRENRARSSRWTLCSLLHSHSQCQKPPPQNQ